MTTYEAEYRWYLQRCVVHYADTYRTAHALEVYTSNQADHIAAECAYFMDNGILPEWALILESVETVGDDHIFIHNSLTEVQ